MIKILTSVLLILTSSCSANSKFASKFSVNKKNKVYAKAKKDPTEVNFEKYNTRRGRSFLGIGYKRKSENFDFDILFQDRRIFSIKIKSLF